MLTIDTLLPTIETRILIVTILMLEECQDTNKTRKEQVHCENERNLLYDLIRVTNDLSI